MWRCPYCETFNEDTDNFCAICGGSRTTAPKIDKSPADMPFTAVETSAAASPAPRPRPANMWDNGEGLGGAKDLRAMAAKHEAEHREKKVRDAEIRRKLAEKKPDTEKDAEYERMKYVSSASNPKKSRGILVAFIVIVAIILLHLYIESYSSTHSSLQQGTYASVTESDVALRKGPGRDSDLLSYVTKHETVEYLGVTLTDDYGNDWCKVTHDNETGYIKRDYLDFK